MVRQRQLRDRHSVFAWMLTLLLIMQAVLPLTGMSGDSRVYAASPETAQFELDVSDDMIYYGDWFTRLMEFKYKETGDRERAYCMNPELYPPGEGTHTATIYNYKNVPDSYRALWKALYYLEGGPGYGQVASVWDSVYHYDPARPNAWNSGREQVYALSHMVVSELSPVGSTGTVGAGSEYINLMNAMIKKIKSMPDPPKTFQIAVYISGSDLQNLTGYCAPLSVTGTISLKKETADTAVNGNGAYSLDGAVYGVYYDKGLQQEAASITTGKEGKAPPLTIDEGTYYIREKKPSKGYDLDRTTYTVEVEADKNVTVTSKEAPLKGVLSLVKYSDAPDWTADNEQYSLDGAEYTVYRNNQNGSLSGEAGTFVTDGTGRARKDLELYAGEYYIKETKAPLGFDPDPAVHAVTVKVGAYNEAAIVTRGESTDVARKGFLKLHKQTANEDISGSNHCYSLAGAVYGVYRTREDAENDTRRVDTLTTNEAGDSQVIELYGHDYYVRELTPSEGFATDKTIYPIRVTIDKESLVISTEEPKYDPVRLLLEKTDAATGGKYPQGGATLEGAIFAADYFDGYIDADSEKEDADRKPARTWIFRTDANGEVLLDADHFVEGDPFYLDQDGNPVLPLGTLRVREVFASEGYKLNTETFYCQITDDGNDVPQVETYQSPVVPQIIKRGDLKGVKIYDRTAHRGGRIVFRLTSAATGESHILVTDENGCFSTSGDWALHEEKTNSNDGAVSAEGVVDEAKLDDAAGVWFSGRHPDDPCRGAAPEKVSGALPYDEYILDELPCSANEGYELLNGIHIRIRYDVQDVPARGLVDLGTLTNDEKEKPSLKTEACDQATGGHEGNATGTVTIRDTVTYKGLTPGKTYTVSGVLMNRRTGLPVTSGGVPVTAGTTFTADKKNGSLELLFTCDADNVRGSSVVVYETLYENDVEIASHRDLTDDRQTVTYPALSTRAAETNPGMIVDTVSYSGLVPGKTYTMAATLFNPSSQGMVEGKKGTVTFRPEKSNGHVEVAVDASDLAGETVVVYETLTNANGKIVGEHHDPACKSQTVTVTKPDVQAAPAPAGKPHAPKTGDPSHAAAVLFLMMSAAAVSAGFAWRRE